MLCEKCGKNEAVSTYKETRNGKETTYHLCRDCAEEIQKSWGVNDLFGESPFAQMHKLLSGDDFFGSLLGTSQTPAQKERQSSKTCPLCGSLFADLVKTGKAGCPGCYETFEAELLPSIRRIHGRSTHTGHAPAKFREENEKKQKIAGLEKELKEAITAENYERAAEIRDTLRSMRDAGGEA